MITSDLVGRLIGVLSANRVRNHGLVFDARSSDFSPRVRAQMFWGIYEGTEIRMTRDLLRGCTTVVELGSGLGVTSSHIAALMAPGGHLVCVEANLRLLPGLRDRLARHAVSVRVDLVHAAVAGHCGDAALALSAARSAPASARHGRGKRWSRCRRLRCARFLRQTGVVDFDLVLRHRRRRGRFLLRDPDVLSRCRRVVIELHDTADGGQSVTVSALLEAASGAGFRVVRRHGPVVTIGPPHEGGPAVDQTETAAISGP